MKFSTVVLIMACLLLSLVFASSGRRSRGRKIRRMKNSSGDKSGSPEKTSSGGKSDSGGKSSSGGKSNSGGKSSSGGKGSSGGKSSTGGKGSSGGKSGSGGKSSDESKGKWTTAPTTKRTTVLTSAPITAPTTEQTPVSTSAPTTTLTMAPITEQITVLTSAPTTSPSTAPTTEQTIVLTSAPTTTPTRPPTTEETTVPDTSPTMIDPTVCTVPSASSEEGLPLPRDCWDLQQIYEVHKDGVYKVYPTERVNICVLCDMTTDGGGWTIFQQRYNGSVNFNQKYVDYENGFGDLKTEFWMGNDFLHQFTTIENQTLRFDFCNKDNSSKYAIYYSFAIGNGSDCYRLHVADYNGTAHDSLIGSFKDLKNDGQCFSAYDKDQDNLKYDSCALDNKSGWWFNMCSAAYLNIPFINGVLFWSARELIKGSQMKFRPSHARNVYPMSKPFKCPINS